jgi:L-lactate dehydrogenase complex protein LldG
MSDRNLMLSHIRRGTLSGRAVEKGLLEGKKKKEDLILEWEKIQQQRAAQLSSLTDQFQKECELLSIKVYEARTHDEALQSLTSIIKETGTRQAIRWNIPFMDHLKIDGLLKSMGVAYAEKDELADLGISGADYALADTGTLVLRTRLGQDRSSSLLPPIHVAFLKQERIIPGLDELIVRIRLDLEEVSSPHSCLTLITGPSKTADIEMTLVHGIHGPKEVHVVVLRNITETRP